MNPKETVSHDDKDVLKGQQNTNIFCKGCTRIRSCEIGRIAYIAGCHHNEVNAAKNMPSIKSALKTSKQNNNLTTDMSMLNDNDYVSRLTSEDISDWSRYKLFKCNKKRKALGLEPLRREK